MPFQGFYLVAYDIADEKRLNRVRRIMKDEGLAVQYSLFLVQGDQDFIERLMDRLQSVIKDMEDDIRAYPVSCITEILTNGHNPLKNYPLMLLGD